MAPRITPEKDAMHHILNKFDKQKLEVKYISPVKGRGLFAKGPFDKGEFVVEYRGDLIDCTELDRRKRVYHPSCAAFLFEFIWRGKMWCIDASIENGTYGRIVNDDHKTPNCRMKRVDVGGSPHLCLFTMRHIKMGEEITHDYGDDDCPWRHGPTDHTAADGTARRGLDQSVRSEPQNDSSLSRKEINHTAADGTARRGLDPSVRSEPQNDSSLSPKEINHTAADGTARRGLDPSVRSEPQNDSSLSPKEILPWPTFEKKFSVPRLRLTESVFNIVHHPRNKDQASVLRQRKNHFTENKPMCETI